jgi:hypothetical protein
MAEDSYYIDLSEECARCLLKARTSENEADIWVWLLLGKSWLNLIDARRSIADEQPPKPNIRTLAGRAPHA